MQRLISIWFFVGCLLSLYGLLIFAAGLRAYSALPDDPGPTDHLHLPIWWGIFMLVLGITYVLHFRPKR